MRSIWYNDTGGDCTIWANQDDTAKILKAKFLNTEVELEDYKTASLRRKKEENERRRNRPFLLFWWPWPLLWF